MPAPQTNCSTTHTGLYTPSVSAGTLTTAPATVPATEVAQLSFLSRSHQNCGAECPGSRQPGPPSELSLGRRECRGDSSGRASSDESRSEASEGGLGYPTFNCSWRTGRYYECVSPAGNICLDRALTYCIHRRRTWSDPAARWSVPALTSTLLSLASPTDNPLVSPDQYSVSTLITPWRISNVLQVPVMTNRPRHPTPPIV